MSVPERTLSAEEEAERRAMGLRPVTVWAIDTTAPGFEERMALAVAAVKTAECFAEEQDVLAFIESHWAQMDALEPPYDWGEEGPPV